MSERDIAKSSKVFSKILEQYSNDSGGWFTVSEIEPDVDASRDTVERRIRDLYNLEDLERRTRKVNGVGDNPLEYRLNI